MKLVREGTFETNSSSTHAIVITKENNPKKYNFEDGNDREYYFSRDNGKLVDTWNEKLAYCYAIISNHPKTTSYELEVFKEKVARLYKKAYEEMKLANEKRQIKGSPPIKTIREIKKNISYVDRYRDLMESDFVDRLLEDEDFLERFLFSKDSYITLGSDDKRGYNIKTIGFEYDYEDRDEFWKKLEEYKKFNDVHLKGSEKQ